MVHLCSNFSQSQRKDLQVISCKYAFIHALNLISCHDSNDDSICDPSLRAQITPLVLVRALKTLKNFLTLERILYCVCHMHHSLRTFRPSAALVRISSRNTPSIQLVPLVGKSCQPFELECDLSGTYRGVLQTHPAVSDICRQRSRLLHGLSKSHYHTTDKNNLTFLTPEPTTRIGRVFRG